MNAKIGFKLQVTATPGFHSLYDLCFQMIWRFSGAPEDSENDTVRAKHGAEALYSAVKSLIYAIKTKDKEAHLDATHRMIHIAKPWTICWWSESKLADGKPLIMIPKNNPHLIDLKWTTEEQEHPKTLVERYTSQGASEAWRVYRLWLTCFSLVLGDTEDRNGVSGQWHDEWALDTWVESLIFRSLRETFFPILVKEPAEYPEPDQDDASRAMLLPEERNDNAPPSAPPPHMAVLLLSASWPSSSFQLVANEVVWR